MHFTVVSDARPTCRQLSYIGRDATFLHITILGNAAQVRLTIYGNIKRRHQVDILRYQVAHRSCRGPTSELFHRSLYLFSHFVV